MIRKECLPLLRSADCYNREHFATFNKPPRGLLCRAGVLSHNMFGHFLGRSDMYPLK